MQVGLLRQKLDSLEKCNLAMTQNYEGQLQTLKAQVRKLALFCVWKDARVCAHCNHYFHMHLSYLGAGSCIFPQCSPQEVAVT